MSPDSLYFDRNGKPIDLRELARLCGDGGYNVVARDFVDGVEISTLWLGFDHSLRSNDPILFETNVFGGSMDLYHRRYATEAQALAGHVRVVAAVRRTIAPAVQGTGDRGEAKPAPAEQAPVDGRPGNEGSARR